MDFSSPLALRLLLLFPIVFVGALLALYSETRRGILFGVTVSLDYARSRYARAALRNYRLQVLALALTDLLISAILVWTPERILSARILVALFAVPSELVAARFLWRYHGRLVEPHAAIVPLQRHTEPVPPSTTLPLVAIVFSLTPLALTALFLHRYFDQLPGRWPIHWDLMGTANAWATRSIASVFGPLAIGVFIVLLFFGISLAMARDTSPTFLQRRRALAPMAALSWTIAVLISFIGLLPVTNAAPDRLMLIIAIYLALALGITLWLLHRSGLVLKPSAPADEPASDPGFHGGGVLYYDPSNGAVLVPKRFGIGWTLNFARSLSWVYLGAIFLFVLSILVLIK
ncbi:MAG: DUF5808 domain-containing protein [Acidobacteriaceae bacterium]